VATFNSTLAAQKAALDQTIADTVREARGDGPNTGGKLGPDELQRKALAVQTGFSAFAGAVEAAGNSAFV
jgi:hypothetical protein